MEPLEDPLSPVLPEAPEASEPDDVVPDEVAPDDPSLELVEPEVDELDEEVEDSGADVDPLEPDDDAPPPDVVFVPELVLDPELDPPENKVIPPRVIGMLDSIAPDPHGFPSLDSAGRANDEIRRDKGCGRDRRWNVLRERGFTDEACDLCLSVFRSWARLGQANSGRRREEASLRGKVTTHVVQRPRGSIKDYRGVPVRPQCSRTEL